MRGIIDRAAAWGGAPIKLLLVAIALSLAGSILTILATPMAAIPIVDFLISPIFVFPTVFCYSVAGFVAYVALRPTVGLICPWPSGAQWLALAFALAAVGAVGFGAPKLLNSAVGLKTATRQMKPPPVALQRGQPIALISYGVPEYASCEALCLSLLVSGEAAAVEVASSTKEPGPMEVLGGKRFRLKSDFKGCMSGKPAYYLTANSSREVRQRLFELVLPREYAECLHVESVIVDPARQLTLVEWIGSDEIETPRRLGYSGNVAIVRTVTPSVGRRPQVREARYRAGWKYTEPFFIFPYAGNAAVGSYFSPSISIEYFQDLGFPDSLAPRLWSLISDGASLRESTTAWLDTVVASPQR